MADESPGRWKGRSRRRSAQIPQQIAAASLKQGSRGGLFSYSSVVKHRGLIGEMPIKGMTNLWATQGNPNLNVAGCDKFLGKTRAN
jgi:hypothetical protein